MIFCLIDFSSILIYFRSFLIDKWLSDRDSNFRFSRFSMKSRFWRYLKVFSSILIISDRILKFWKKSKNLKNDDDGWWLMINDHGWSMITDDHGWSMMIGPWGPMGVPMGPMSIIFFIIFIIIITSIIIIVHQKHQ